MLANRIRDLLDKRPYWSPKRVAEELGTSARVITVTASRDAIRFMDRADFEKWVDDLVDGKKRNG